MTTAKKKAARPATPQVETTIDSPSALDRLIADADGEASESAMLTLHGRAASVELELPAPIDWGVDAYPALERGDLNAWARAALSADDFELWLEADPTIRQAMAFLRGWTAATGEEPGESSASQRS